MSSAPAAAPQVLADEDRDVQWRPTQKDLWVARRDGRHLGTVERGRRFLAFDADGEPIGSYRTLAAARTAVAAQCSREHRAPRRTRSWGAAALVAALCLVVGAALLAYALLLV
ncbi:MAG: hypothetical protein ACTHJL_10320 [Amnibacterium sp.]